MMSEVKQKVFICACQDLDHQFVITSYDYTKDEDMSLHPKADLHWYIGLMISVHLVSYYGFWRRIWIAIKYIFGQDKKYGHFDCIEIPHDDIRTLATMCEQTAIVIDETYERMLNDTLSGERND